MQPKRTESSPIAGVSTAPPTMAIAINEPPNLAASPRPRIPWISWPVLQTTGQSTWQFRSSALCSGFAPTTLVRGRLGTGIRRARRSVPQGRIADDKHRVENHADRLRSRFRVEDIKQDRGRALANQLASLIDAGQWNAKRVVVM